MGQRSLGLVYITCVTPFLLLLLLPIHGSASEECYLETPSGYQSIKGGSRLGPYSSRSECESLNSEYFDGNGTCYCSYTKPAPSPAPTPSPEYRGEPHVDSETIRRQQEEEQRRREQEEAERRERERQAEEARRRAFEKEKEEALELLKGSTLDADDSGTNDLKLKGTTSDLGLKGDAVSGAEPKLKDLETSKPAATLKQPLFEKGYKGSAPPYLADLDPKWPIVVDPAKVQGKTPQALRTANRRTHIVLDALEVGQGDWKASIRYLENRLAVSPKDTEVRDALNYVWGLYQGYIRARDTADSYYKYGVRQWLDGDYDGAARAFQQAVRQNPDDVVAFSTFAQTLGLRDGSGECRCRGGCSLFIHPPANVLFTPEDEKRLHTLRREVKRNPADLERRLTLYVLEGYAAYADYVNASAEAPQQAFDAKTRSLVSEGLAMIGRKDFANARRFFAKAYLYNSQVRRIDDRGLFFVMNYADGLDTAQKGDDVIDGFDPRFKEAVKEYEHRMVDDLAQWVTKKEIKRFNALVKQREQATRSPANLRKELMDVKKRNPFFGLLSDDEMKELESLLLFGSEGPVSR